MTTVNADLEDYNFGDLPIGTKITLPNGSVCTVVDQIQGPVTPSPAEEQTEEGAIRKAVAVTLNRPITGLHAEEIRFLLDQEGFTLVRKTIAQQPVPIDPIRMSKPYWDIPTSVGMSLDIVFNSKADPDMYADRERIITFIEDLQKRGYAIVAPAVETRDVLLEDHKHD